MQKDDGEKMTNRSIQGDFSIPIPLANLLDESSKTKVKIFKIKKNRNQKKREKEKKKQKLKKKSLKVIVLKKNMKY